MLYRINCFAVKVQKQASAMDLILLHRCLIKTQSVVSAQGLAALNTLIYFPWGSNRGSRTHFWHLISISLASSFYSCPSTCLPVCLTNEVFGFSTPLHHCCFLYNVFQRLLTDICVCACACILINTEQSWHLNVKLNHNLYYMINLSFRLSKCARKVLSTYFLLYTHL